MLKSQAYLGWGLRRTEKNDKTYTIRDLNNMQALHATFEQWQATFRLSDNTRNHIYNLLIKQFISWYHKHKWHHQLSFEAITYPASTVPYRKANATPPFRTNEIWNAISRLADLCNSLSLKLGQIHNNLSFQLQLDELIPSWWCQGLANLGLGSFIIGYDSTAGSSQIIQAT